MNTINKNGLFELPKQQSGMFELTKQEVCLDPSHNPPTHMVIPYGYGYRHVCPRCNKVQIIQDRIAFVG